MANNLADYAENKILAHSVGKAAWTMPTAYIALYTVAPGEAGGGTECTGGAYARVTTAAADWNAASGGSISNAADIVFPEATASWGTVVSLAILDASTVGNFIWYGALAANKTVDIGDTVRFVAGDLVLSLN